MERRNRTEFSGVRVCGIYAINRIGTDNFYVGQSINIWKRWIKHLQDLRTNRHSSVFLQRSFNKHGESAFEFSVLEAGTDPRDKQALTRAEQRWMDTLNSCFNWAPAAGSNAGIKLSADTRAKMSLAHRGNKVNLGRPSPRKGTKLSSETCQRISVAKKGFPGPNKGIPRTAEVKAKISATKIRNALAKKLASSAISSHEEELLSCQIQ